MLDDDLGQNWLGEPRFTKQNQNVIPPKSAKYFGYYVKMLAKLRISLKFMNWPLLVL